MGDLYALTNPVFQVFLSYAAVVLLKTGFMSILTAFNRMKNRAFANEEDAKGLAKTLKVHPLVERIRRAHLNDIENVYLFVLIGFLYIACSPSLFAATVHFRVFAISRIIHTIVYVGQIPQPTRALAFATGFVVNISMAVQVLMHVATF